MKINKCRVCNHKLYQEPLLRFKNMPAKAQYLPDNNSVKKDKGVNLNIFECSGCGLVQLINEPVSYYREVIRASGFSEEMKKFRTTQFSDFIKKYNLKQKKIIEIGCGKGEYLSIINDTGVKVFGLEYNKQSVMQCKSNGLNVVEGYINNENIKLKYAPFDAFMMLNFLEHLPNLNIVMSGIFNNLSEDAVGIIEVPNFNMILQKKLFSEFMRDHIFYFTNETFIRTLELNGYEVLELKNVWHEYIISAIVRKRKKLNIKNFRIQQEKIKKEVVGYIDKFGVKKVAIWGAGHQSFAIISILGLSKRIKYVVDSAIFKQGRYVPAAHVPITSPEILSKDPPKAIIVIAGSYSDEISNILRQKYKDKMSIAILRDFGLEYLTS